MLDLSMLDKSNMEDGKCTASATVQLLPKFQTSQNELTIQDENLELILNPVFDFLPDYIPIKPYRIDTRIPYYQYNSLRNTLQELPLSIDPLDNKPVFATIAGKMRIQQMEKVTSERPGYTIHLSTSHENFDLASNYLSAVYNMDKFENPLRNTRIKHLEKKDFKNHTIIHSFIDGGIINYVVLHIEDDRQFEILPIPIIKNIAETKVIIQPNLKRTIFESNSNKFFIDELPILEGDTRDKQEILRTFIESTSSILDLGRFYVMHDDKIIYKNSDDTTFYKKNRVGQLSIYYTNEKQSYAGAEIFLSLLSARLKYAFEIDSISYNAHNKESRYNIRELLRKKFKNSLNEKQEGLNQVNFVFETEDKVQIILSLDRAINRHLKSQFTWEVVNLQDNFENIKDIIKENINEIPVIENSTLFHIKKYSPRNGSYNIILNRYSKN